MLTPKFILIAILSYGNNVTTLNVEFDKIQTCNEAKRQMLFSDRYAVLNIMCVKK